VHAVTALIAPSGRVRGPAAGPALPGASFLGPHARHAGAGPAADPLGDAVTFRGQSSGLALAPVGNEKWS
jgi:hypothetical protein